MSYWVLNGQEFQSSITYNDGKLVLSNGLIERTVLPEKCITSSFKSLNNSELISNPRSDFVLTVNGEKLTAENSFVFTGVNFVPCVERVPFKRTATMTYKGEYPPPGKAAELNFVSEKNQLNVTVRYEIYDGMPVMMKMVSVKNTGNDSVIVDNISTDVLEITSCRDTLFVDSDFDSTTDFLGLTFLIMHKIMQDTALMFLMFLRNTE